MPATSYDGLQRQIECPRRTVRLARCGALKHRCCPTATTRGEPPNPVAGEFREHVRNPLGANPLLCGGILRSSSYCMADSRAVSQLTSNSSVERTIIGRLCWPPRSARQTLSVSFPAPFERRLTGRSTGGSGSIVHIPASATHGSFPCVADVRPRRARRPMNRYRADCDRTL